MKLTHRKAISYIIGFALILGLSISAIAIVYAVVIPQIETKKTEAAILDAISTLKLLDSKIDDLLGQGSNSSIILTLKVPKGVFKISPTSGYSVEILYQSSGAGNQTMYIGSLGRLTYNTSYSRKLMGENEYQVLYGSGYHYVKSDSSERENAQIIESQKGSTIVIGLKYRVIFHMYERDIDGDGDNDYDVVFLLIKLTTDTGANLIFLGNRKLLIKHTGSQIIYEQQESRTSTFYIRGWDADQNDNFDEEIATVTLSTGQILRIMVLQVNIVIGVQ